MLGEISIKLRCRERVSSQCGRDSSQELAEQGFVLESSLQYKHLISAHGLQDKRPQ